MPRYQYDPSKAQATIEVFPKNAYLVKVGTPKAFGKKEEKSDELKNFGIMFQLHIAEVMPGEDPKIVGKNTIFRAYLHNDGSQSMTKRFQMAALGYRNTPDEEKRFDAEQAGKDWGFDPDTGAVGEAWQQFSGSSLVANLDVGKNNNTGEPQQNFQSWAPLASWQSAPQA